MSKKLFTKLDIGSPLGDSERNVAVLLESIVATSA
jgi:hypothetical protein